jgi:hypothetical protein
MVFGFMCFHDEMSQGICDEMLNILNAHLCDTHHHTTGIVAKKINFDFR